MKNLKIKFELFSLLAVLAVSVFLTSCEQDNTVLSVLEESQLIDDSRVFQIPDEYLNSSEAELALFIENLSNEDLEKLELAPLHSNQIYLESRSCSAWYRHWTAPNCSWGEDRKWCATATSFWYRSSPVHPGC